MTIDLETNVSSLESCVRDILCALSAPVLTAFDSYLAATVGLLTLQLAALVEKILYTEFITAQAQAAIAIYEQAIARIQGPAQLIPFNAVIDCADLGQVFVDIDNFIADLRANLQIKVDELLRLISLRDELAATRQRIQDTIDRINLIRGLIETCEDILT